LGILLRKSSKKNLFKFFFCSGDQEAPIHVVSSDKPPSTMWTAPLHIP